MNQVPPPTSPVTGALLPQAGGAATPICPAGTLSAVLLSKIAPAYHAGPGIISTLPVYALVNSGVKKMSVVIDLLAISLSKRAAICVQPVVLVLMVIARGAVTSLAWHWLDPM